MIFLLIDLSCWRRKMRMTIKDMTINEADGYFDRVQKLMIESSIASLEKWMIDTQVGIEKGSEDSYSEVQFWNNKECILTQYASTFTSEYYPADLLYFYQWLRDRDWVFVISDDLRSMAPDYWSTFDQVINDDEYVSDDYVDYDDDDDLDFLEYKEKSFAHKTPTVNKYDATEELPEFKDHKYDLEKRNKEEQGSWF